MLYLIDHNDSFTYNLAAQIRQYNEKVTVINVENTKDILTFNDVEAIIFSPGPKAPIDYPESLFLIEQFYNKVPLIGVCLGHQMIGHYFGATISKGKKPVQGYVEKLKYTKTEPIFKDITEPFMVTRYHSLKVEKLPEKLEAVAWSCDDVIQILKHKDYPIYGLQFHPESVGTIQGDKLIYNILKEVGLCV